jgi:dCTP deaminase
MSLLSYVDLAHLALNGAVTNVTPELINGTSIDVTLGSRLLLERASGNGMHHISLRDRDALHTRTHDMDDDGYALYPGEFVLAHTEQVFNLPGDLSAEYKLKSSMARIGLEHLNAGWCDPGWNGSVLTLELVNVSRFHTVRLHAGDRIGQVVFFRHQQVPRTASYAVRGRYNGDAEVSGVKCDDSIRQPAVVHGVNCHKIPHTGLGYLHGEFDDTPYAVDGLRYCGRCHTAL